MSFFVVAYHIPHNEGLEQGIIDGPGFDSEFTLVDLYEVDAQIKSFASHNEAQNWLDHLALDRANGYDRENDHNHDDQCLVQIRPNVWGCIREDNE